MTALAIGSFASAPPFRAAVAALREKERRIVGLWSPLPTEVPDAPTGGQRSIAGTMAAVGLAGAAALYLLNWWSAAIAYPLNSGDRPLHSWQAFLVAPVEFGALAAAIGGVIAFLIRARLTRLHDAAFDIDEACDGMTDRFVIAVACDDGADANGLVALLGEAGAVHTRIASR